MIMTGNLMELIETLFKIVKLQTDLLQKQAVALEQVNIYNSIIDDETLKEINELKKETKCL